MIPEVRSPTDCKEGEACSRVGKTQLFLADRAPDTMSFEPLEFRKTLGCFATGIVVVTTLEADGKPLGITVNSFSSVSLDPPLVSFCVDIKARSAEIFSAADHLVINILAHDQEAASASFARRGETDRFAGLPWEPGIGGVPVLLGCLANLECKRDAVHEAGDHILVLGRVEHLRRSGDEGDPLLYFRGRYARLGEPPAL